MQREQLNSKRKRIKLEAQALYDLADNFYQTGNEKVSETLISSANAIERLAEGIMKDFDRSNK